MFFFLSSNVFNYFNMFLSTEIRAGNNSIIVWFLKYIVTGVYYIIPDTTPFSDKITELLSDPVLNPVEMPTLESPENPPLSGVKRPGDGALGVQGIVPWGTWGIVPWRAYRIAHPWIYGEPTGESTPESG